MPSLQSDSLNSPHHHAGQRSQWLLTPTELRQTPSIIEGLTLEQEVANRRKGINFITQVGIMLKLPQMTLATASVYFHRFYVRYQMAIKDKGIHHYQMAGTALFLAGKVEENSRKMQELIVACCRVAQKQPNLIVDEQSKEFWKWRDTILFNELYLLDALCFDLQLEHPYPILYDFLRDCGVQDNKNLRNISWAFLNDSQVTTLCLQITPRALAGAALYAGAKLAGVSIPDEAGKPWWEQLDLDIFDMQQACNVMADTYQNPTLPRQGSKDAYTRDSDMMSFERTRLTRSPSFEKSPAHSTRSVSQGVKRDREEGWGIEPQRNGTGGDTTHNTTSPKRQRLDSRDLDVVTSRVSPARVPPVPQNLSGAISVNDVQQRIDEIVNSSSRVSNGPPSRGPSYSNPSWPRPERRRSSSMSGHQRPMSSNSAMQGEISSHQQGGGGYSSGRRFSHDRIDDQSRNGSRVPQPALTSGREDEAEEVDYGSGSEEGEV